MNSADAAPGATVPTVPDRYPMNNDDLPCNNVADCGNTFQVRGTQARTEDAARVHGWRVWHYETLDLVLCPACIGYRVRRDKPPERLDGEQPLF